MNEDGDNLARQLAGLVSEGRNPRSTDIDLLPTLDMLKIINDEDKGVAVAVEAVLPQVAQAVDMVAGALRSGGRLIYCGAGTSGRLGLLDASECAPTFGVPRGMVIGLMAGGEAAATQAFESAEDSAELGAADLDAVSLTGGDVVVGIAASGRTPYVLGALDRAREVGAQTVALTCNPGSPVAERADISIAPVVGPEVLTGSTRLKAGTAQKLVLNMLSTAAMMRIGHVFGNLMVDVEASNEKLAVRAARIVTQATGCSAERAADLLDRADGAVKLAILMELAGLEAGPARERLDRAGGMLRKALADQ